MTHFHCNRILSIGIVILILSALMCIYPGAAISSNTDEEMELVFFNPDTASLSPVDATNALQSFANVINKKFDLNIRAYFFKKQKDLDKFISERKVDLGILSQMYIMENRDRLNLDILAAPIRDGKKTYNKVIVVRNDSDYNDIFDLKDKVLAATALGEDNVPFYNQVVFRGEIDVLQHFKEIKTVDSPISAMYAVLYKEADAAAVTLTSFNIAQELNPQMKKVLTNIYTSESTPISPMVVFKDNMDYSILPPIKEMLLNIHNNPVGRQTCLAFSVEAWVDSSWADFSDLEKVLAQAGKQQSPAIKVSKPDETAVSAPPPEQVSFKRIQVYQKEAVIYCNVWLEGPQAIKNSGSVELLYSIGSGKEQNISLQKKEDTFSAKINNPQAESSEEDTTVLYTVKSGDTLGKIAAKYLGSSKKYMLIASYNQIENPNIISIGQELKIKSGEITLTEFHYQAVFTGSDGKVVKSIPGKRLL